MSKPKASTVSFKRQLKAYKELIDADIAEYSRGVTQSSMQQFGAYQLHTEAFLSILARGGKRIRGALTILGYEMSGGQNKDMIIEAARAVEMLHTYLLILDDFQDRSVVRRGGPTANVIMENYHRKHRLSGDAEHFGASIAMNAAISGAHAAQMILTSLDVDPELRLKVMGIMNRTLLVTAHGQTGDIMNEVMADVTSEDVELVMEWKTAHYTILNPLHVGMVLAGAGCQETDAITEYALHTGRAFQITDDILGTFGTEFESGKSPLDDIREGKRTLVVLHALEHTTDANKNFLIQMLGNAQLSQAEFARCKDIMLEAGSVEYARELAERYVKSAQELLTIEAHFWDRTGVDFLMGLSEYLLQRTS